MDDLTCHVCAALVTPLGQEGGVFCANAGCPGDRLTAFDATNVCNPTPFVLNFAGEKITVVSGAEVPTAPTPPTKKVKRRPLPAASSRGLFD